MKPAHIVLSSSLPSAILSLLVLVVLLFSCASVKADGVTQYTYSGNLFTTNYLNTCPSVCSLTGSFTLAGPLAGGLNDATISPLSYSFSDGVTTFTQANSSILNFDFFSTTAAGAITEWDIFIGSLDGNSLLATTTEGAFIDLTANFVTGAESDGEVAGSWSSKTINVPEPSNPALLLAGLLTLAALRRKTTLPSAASSRGLA